MYSIIIPLYKAEVYLPALIEALEALQRRLNDPLEAVFVIDGLADNSLAILEKALATASFSSILVIHSRNFGSLAAIRSGLSRATGQFFATMSADLQEPPDLMLDFFDGLSKNQADVVFGQRISRGDPFFSQAMSYLFWTFYRRFIQPDIPKGGVDVFGCNRVFRARLLELYEPNNVLVGTLFWLGFRRKIVPYQRRPNRDGKSTWTLTRKVRYAMDNVLFYSDFPILVILYLGLIVLGISCLGGCGIFLASVKNPAAHYRVASEILIALFFGGMNAVGFGLLGGYLWRLMLSTRRWPQAVVVDERSYGNLNSESVTPTLPATPERPDGSA